MVDLEHGTIGITDLDPDYPPELMLYQDRQATDRRLKDVERLATYLGKELRDLRKTVAALTEPNA